MSIFDSLFSHKKNKKNYALALDIGTELAKALIFEINNKEKQGNVIGIGRARQNLQDMQAGAVTNIPGVIETCEKAIEEAAKELGFIPQQVVLGIAGELVKGTTTTVSYERAKPEAKIDLSELKNIVQKIQWKAFDEARQQLAWETGHSEIDVKLINAAVVDIQIDGYRVTNPLGFQGKNVSVGIFNAYAPLIHLGALQTIIQELGLDLVSITAEPYAVARCMSNEESTDFSAIFIDVGGGTTDIALVRNGGIEGTKMFALGGRTFTKRISEELGISFQEAEEIKLRFSKKGLGRESTQRISEFIKEDLSVWLSGVELSLQEFSANNPLPSRILLCGGGSALFGITQALSENEWIKELPFAKKPKVSFIKPSDITNILDEKKVLKYPYDITPMSLANLALDLVGEEQVLSGILRRVVRMMQK